MVLANAGDGSFGPPSAVSVGRAPRIAAGHTSGDTSVDVAVLDTGSLDVAVFGTNLPDSPPAPPPDVHITLSVAGQTNKPRSVDLRWSGATADAVSASRNGSVITVTENDGQFTNRPPERGTYR